MSIEEIKERHSKIGGTPWKKSEYSMDYYFQGYKVKTWNDLEVASCIEEESEVDFIANAPSDIAYLLSIIEQAEDALKFYADWQTHHKLSASDKITPFEADKGNIANQALKAIRGD